jgi:hypothetical protein
MPTVCALARLLFRSRLHSAYRFAMPTATAGKQTLAPFGLLAGLPNWRGAVKKGGSMRWRIVPVVGAYEYSEEIKETAHTAALKAALDMRIEFIDVTRDAIDLLGPKWKEYFVSTYTSLMRRYGNHLDDLILLADRLDKYTATYDETLRKSAATSSESGIKTLDGTHISSDVYGSLLAQHYAVACRKELLEDMAANSFPGTGEVLEALSINRVMQAALCIDTDIGKALDFLSDAMAAKFLFTQGEMHIESFYALEDKRKIITSLEQRPSKIAKNAGDARGAKFKLLEDETIRLYKAGKWDSVPLAAEEITPKIVTMSKKGRGDLRPSTTKPLEWIRAYNKKKKAASAKHDLH